MMNINLTLLIQLVHFYCAYWLIWWLLLKPALQVITNERKMVQGITSKIERERAIASNKESALEATWADYREQLQQSQPSVQLAGQLQRFEPAIGAREVPVQEIHKQTIEDIAAPLFARVTND